MNEFLGFVLLTAAFYTWHTLGVTIGLHRLLSHRSFHCPKFVEYFWVLAAYLSMQGSPIWWTTIHRAHHRYVDTPLDPHSPRYGLRGSFGFWLKGFYAEHVNPEKLCPELVRDPIYKWLEHDAHKNWDNAYLLNLQCCFMFRIILYKAFGWEVMLASIIAGVLALNVPLWLNVFCHMPRLGYRNVSTGDDSVNVWWMGLICMGEGWHNNHHAVQGSARQGYRWFEFDLSWCVIRLMKMLGLVSWTNEPPLHRKRNPIDTKPEPALANVAS